VVGRVDLIGVVGNRKLPTATIGVAWTEENLLIGKFSWIKDVKPQE